MGSRTRSWDGHRTLQPRAADGDPHLVIGGGLLLPVIAIELNMLLELLEKLAADVKTKVYS